MKKTVVDKRVKSAVKYEVFRVPFHLKNNNDMISKVEKFWARGVFLCILLIKR